MTHVQKNEMEELRAIILGLAGKVESLAQKIDEMAKPKDVDPKKKGA